MAEFIKTVQERDVAVIIVDNPPVNALSSGVPEAIAGAIDRAEGDPAIRAIVILGGGRTFIAGADIKELEAAARNPELAPDIHALLARVENSTKPVVMALHGTALGGGLELAMAGHYRIATPDALLGLPEANLGIIPGAEGTQRLPRLVGIPAAIDLIVSGRLIKSAEAEKLGLIDRIAEAGLQNSAVAFAEEISGRPIPRTCDRAVPSVETLGDVFAAGRAQAAKIRPHQTAPLMALDALEIACKLLFPEGCKSERQMAKEALGTPQAQAMIHLFFAERAVAKVPGLSPDVRSYPVQRIGIIGAGTMGGGIAMACVNAGIPVLLKETTQSALDRGMETIRKNYLRSVQRGRTPQSVMDQRVAMIRPQLDYAGFEDVDLIIEAAYESMDVKREIFGAIDKIAKKDCVLASNTSTLNMDEIANMTSRPEMVVGLHFFSPANAMRLVEIVGGPRVSDKALATAVGIAKMLKKVGVVVGNCYGFVGNRMMFPYLREAQFLVEEGALPEQVDRVLTNFGMAMGPFAVDDLGGIDLLYRVRQEHSHMDKAGVRKPLVHDRMYATGRYGQKTRAGWYTYDEKMKGSPDLFTTELVERVSAELGLVRRAITDQEIIERCLYVMVNEGAKILGEGYAQRAADIDVIYTTGYGFPNWRGGPMWFADSVGLDVIYRRILECEQQFGSDLWAPAPLLKELADRRSAFAAMGT
jgi:3-hydroxyacyl-CoA dehydrogenase